jgi:hypothetical protein
MDLNRVLLAGLLAIGSTAVHAADAEASASIDWSGFQIIDLLNSGITYSLPGSFTNLSSSSSTSNVSGVVSAANDQQSGTLMIIAAPTGSLPDLLELKVPYSLSANLNPADGSPNYADALASLSLIGAGQTLISQQVVDLSVAGSSSLSNNYLTLLVQVSNGESFTLTADTQTSAVVTSASAVPVPTAFWLFGTAIMSFLGLKRRKNV